MTVLIIVIVVVILLAAAAGGYVIAQRKKSQQLQEEFGPEYDRAIERSDSKQEAEKELSERKKRHEQLDLQPLDGETREQFWVQWQRVQGTFVDDPGGAVEEADTLIVTIMRERNYPVEDFDRRAEAVSVEHPQVVEHYREARRVRDAHRDGSADTEDLRGAVTAYRNLVGSLLDEQRGPWTSERSGPSSGSTGSSHGTAHEQGGDGGGQADAASTGTASDREASA